MTILALIIICALSLLAITVVILRVSSLLNSWQRSSSMDKLEYASHLESINREVYQNAMDGLGKVFERVQQSQTENLRAVLDAVVGPQQIHAPDTNDPELDVEHEAAWMERQWLTMDPTDELLPDPPIEPNDLAHRAVSVRPGEGLIPHE